MNLVLALLFAAFADYVIIKGVRDVPLTGILAIIGGNISLYMKTQDSVGKTLVGAIHILKTNEETKQLEDSTDDSTEVQVEVELAEHTLAIAGEIHADQVDVSVRI